MATRKPNKHHLQRSKKRLTIERLEVRQLLASDWQNPGQVWDVNRDLTVSPIDALLGINRLNSGVSRTFPARAIGSTEPYFDVSGEGVHSPLDVLLVINALNRNLPTVSVELQKDSGSGVGASLDRRTNDLSIRGNISRGRATELWGRFAGNDEWKLLKTYSPTSSDQTFTILHADLLAALGIPREGSLTLQLQPRFGVGNAEVGNGADLPIVFDQTPPQFDFDVQPNFLGPISMPVASAIEVPLNERASALTLVASKVKLFNTSYANVSTTLEELSPRGISLSSDGRFLLIEPPVNSQSMSYRVTIQEGAFEDLAGNLNILFNAFAHHFSTTSQSPLSFGQTIDFSTTPRSLREYTFDLTSPDLFILAGLDASSAMQMDLFAPSGQVVRNWVTDATGGSLQLGSINRVMLTELGQYTLRIAAPASTNVSFKALLSKQLSSVPTSLQLQGTFTWSEAHAFAVNVTNQDRIYFENNLNPDTPFQVTVLNQFGRDVIATALIGGDSVFTLPDAGRYIVLIESLTDSVPSSYDYSVYLSQTTFQALTFGQFQQNTIVTPGQQVFYTFNSQAARTYTLEIDSEFGDITLGLPGFLEVNQEGSFAVDESGEGFVLLAFNRADIPSTFLRFRLTEAITQVTPQPTPIVRTEPIQQGVNERQILLELESYEFTFTGATGELFAFRESNPMGLVIFELVAPSGSIVQPVQQVEGLQIYRIPYAGQYRLRAYGEIGANIVFQWQRLATAPVLGANANIEGNIVNETFAAYRFVANSARFFVYPTGIADGLIWKLIDENGTVVKESDFGLNFAAETISGRSYTLFVEKQGVLASEQFQFSRRNTVNGSRTGTVGTTSNGTLLLRGDRVVIEYSLVAGQLLDLTSNLDPGLARVSWLDYSINESDGPREIDPNVPTLVGSTRKYRVEIENLTNAEVNYSVRFDVLQTPLSPPSTLSGFDQVRSGNVGSGPQIFTFNVSAGAYYMFDWLLEDNPNLQIDITDPSGNSANSVAAGADSLLGVTEADGTLTVQIVNFDVTDHPFSFRMISPSTGETVTLGVSKSTTVMPYGSAFFRVALGSTTEVFLQSALDPNNSTSLYRLGSIDPLGIPVEGPLFSGQFLVGDAVVWANNVTAEDYVTEFTAVNVAALTEVLLNSPVILQTVPNVQYFVPFKTTIANTIIGNSGFEIYDQGGMLVDPILNGTAYLLKQPGSYRALIVASDVTTQIELHTQVESNATATLGSRVNGTIPRVGDVNRYSLSLTAGAPILLTLDASQNGFARWIAPNGEVLNSLMAGSTILPVYTTGTYLLELYARTDTSDFAFELNDLSQATAISSGANSGNTGTGLIEINRLVASPNQLIELQDVSVQQVQLTMVDRLGKPLPQVSFANRFFNQVPADGVVYILIQAAPGNSATDYSYFIDLVTTQTQTATIGQPITGTLATRLQGRAYTFTVAQPTWLRVSSVSSDSAVLVLRMADGSLLSSPEGFFTLLLAGNYEVGIYNDARSVNNFTMTIDLLSQATTLPLNQTTTINKTGRYRLDISSPGRFEMQLQNSNNLPLLVEELLVTHVNGSEVILDNRGTFEAGSYWVTFNPASTLPAGDYKLTVASITTTESTLAPNVLGEYTLNANGLQEHLITVPLTPGMRLLIDELQLGSGGRVEARFNGDTEGDWTSIEQLPLIHLGTTGNETLQFRFAGTGQVRLHVIDLNVAPQLTLGNTVSIDLDSRRRGQAWQIGGNVGDIIDFINNSNTERPALWCIVDEVGNAVLSAINEPMNFAIVNKQRFSLVVVATERLTATVNVPFRTVVS
ncbi:MAG: dockerin type I domain-containing protein [Pirellulaceae bacterium]|nr:dockerin type I domain-containing protein [Pirellulaceae bacterium]